MTRLSGTTRFMFLAFVTIAVIAILQTSTPISESSIDRRAEIWWQSNTETSTQSQDSREFILSNEPCPNNIPLLEPKQVDVVDLELSLFLTYLGLSLWSSLTLKMVSWRKGTASFMRLILRAYWLSLSLTSLLTPAIKWIKGYWG